MILNRSSFRVVVCFVSVLLSVFFLLSMGENAYCVEDGFVALNPGDTPHFGSLDNELITYLNEHSNFTDGKLQIKVVVNKQGKKPKKTQEEITVEDQQEQIGENLEDSKEYIDSLKAKVIAKFKEAGVNIKARQIKVDFVTFEPTEEEKIEELNEIIERRVENDLFIHGQAKSFLEQTLLNPQELEKVDPQILKRVVTVYNIIVEELNRIATQQPALFNKTHLDSIASEDVETLLSQVSADKKAQVISELAAVFESSPEQVSAIFGISDPDILKKSIPQKVAEGVFNSLVTVKYVAVTLVQTLRVPIKDISVSEMTQGMIPKLYALAQSFGWNSYIYHDKPAFFVSAFSMSIILDTFHGVEASGWMDFQNRMVQEKGSNFVTVFNMTYDLMIKMMFRTNAFLAGNMPLVGSQEGVINLIWLGFTYVTAISGSVVGTEAYAALNRLHFEKFVFSKRVRDFMQQYVRDFFYLFLGVMLGTGAETNPWTYGVFGTSILLDSTLYYLSQVMPQKPALLVGNIDTLMNPKLGYTYPHLKNPKEVIPVGGVSKSEALNKTGALLQKALTALVHPCRTLFGGK